LKKKKENRKKAIPPGRDKQPSLPPSENTCLLINIVLAGIIVFIFIYSALFSPSGADYPVKCIHEQLTGEPCPSCGLSRSFSYIIRGDIEAALMLNPYGLRVFLFFLFHLVMRISNIIFIIRKPQYTRELVLADSGLAIITFLLAFGQFFAWYFNLFF